MTQTLTTDEELKHLASSGNPNELTRSLARELLASREAQPAAEVLSSRSGNDTSTIDKALPAGTKVYIASPVSAVPDARTERDYEQTEKWNGPDPYCMGHLDGWNAYRSAMLAAAPEGSN